MSDSDQVSLSRANHQMMLFAEYFEFYLQDERSEIDISDIWDDDSEMRMVAIADNILVVRTVRDMDVAVTVEIGDGEPDDDLDEWDHVVQSNIDVPSGRLILSGPTEDYDMAKRVDLEPGNYGVRLYFGMLDEIDDEGFEGDDFYKIYLWRSDRKPTKTLKQWVPVAQN